MTVIFGVDLTQDGGQVISEVFMNYFTQVEQDKLTELMLIEHDQVFIDYINPNSSFLLDLLKNAKEIIK